MLVDPPRQQPGQDQVWSSYPGLKSQEIGLTVFLERLANGQYRAWLVESAPEQVIAGAGIIVFDYHSSPLDPCPRRPVIVNVFTERAHRRQGIARKLMEILVEWCREEGFGSILLHASNEGRPLYDSLGFKPTNEMRLMLR